MQSPVHALQGSLSPPTVCSVPSSPCRRSCNGATPRARSSVSSMDRAGSSAILERRDVRPDDDRGSSTSLAMIARSDSGLQLPEPFSSSLQEVARFRLSKSSQCSAPPSLPAELRIPAGLPQYRASIKPLAGYGAEHHSGSLHRQHRKYSESQQSPLRTQTPPPSPQRHGGSAGHLSLDRMSPFRRSLQRDSSGALVEIISRRRSGSSSSSSSVFLDSPLTQPDGLMEGHMTTGNVQSVRMKAMEEQIASLAGLVHHALSIGPEAAGATDAVSESSGTKLCKRNGDPSESPGISAASSVTKRDRELQLRLALARRSVSELRVQLNQLRSLQILNQQSVSSMLQTASQKLLKLICEQQAQAEQTFKPRAEMDLQRIHFLETEETILTQLRELEDFVEGLSQPAVTLRDVEEGAVNLRRVGEALAKLKGEFPGLQVKMRSVLRPEVEAVRFLKEEPHKMDSMLRRVRTLTETLSALRRSVSESSSVVRSDHVETVKVLDDNPIPPQTRSPQFSPKPQPRPRLDQNQSSHLCTNGAPALHFGRDSPTVVKVTPQSREGSPGLHRKPEPKHNQNRSITSQDSSSHHGVKADRVFHRSVSQEDSRATLQNQDNPTVTSVCEYDVWIPRETTAHTEPSEVERDADRGPQASVQRKPACDDQRGGAPVVREKVEDSKAASSQLPPKDSGTPSASPTKPRRAVKQSSDGASTSSPPPPPRRIQTTSPSLTTESYSGRIPPVGAQDKSRNEKQLPQPKPPRQPPEVKPKPQIFARTSPTAATSLSSALGPTLQELQVKSELSSKNHLSGEIEQKSKGRTKTSLISDMPQLRRADEGKDHLVLQRDKKKVELGFISEKTTVVEKEEKPPTVPVRMNFTAQKKLTTEAGDSPTKKDFALSPSSVENKVKVTTIVTLQKENPQEAPTSPKKTHQEAEKKSNVTVVVTLQKENTPTAPSTRSLSASQVNGSVDLGKENLTTYFLSSTHSSEPQMEEAYVKATDSLLSSEEGGTLSLTDEGPPPPPPPMGKFKQRSRTKTRFICVDEPTNSDASDLQPNEVDFSTDDGNQEPKDFEEDEDLRNKPIIVILNEPIDPQMAYKRLSTIFESEEDLPGAPLKMSLERKILQEKKISSKTTAEESKQVQDEQKRASPETESSPQVQHGKLSADPLSVPEDQKKPESPQKTEQKRKFKFKFPKNKLASLSQVIRTNKAEKKTLKLVVYEEEEEMQPDKNTKNRTKAPTSLEITSSKAEDVKVSLSRSHTRVEQLRRNTFDTINSLEESIKQLEISVDSISSPLPESPTSPLDSTHRGQVKTRTSRERERSPSKRHASNPPKGPNSPQSKKAKAQPGRDTARTTARRQTSNSSSSALRSHTKTHQSSSSSPPEKTSRTHRQDTQTQSSEPSFI
ncbi:sickle tail protein-like isoform X2 [Gouania willdenowi]|nr:sickle tail protein-like isoform X2 [Gouania willdenowi]